MAKPEPRLNEEINCAQCRLIDYDGNQMGVFTLSQALDIAAAAGYDLVEIAPDAKPPVCRVMNYGKYKYEQAVKAKQAKKNQTKIEVKEMKFRPKIDVGDYETKKKHVLRFLGDGNKVKITIMFRGREMAHPEQGISILERLADDLSDVAVVESKPILEGRNMHMTIAPSGKSGNKKQATQSRKAQRAAKQREAAKKQEEE
ncbi:translation initiation factor IF-3 [Phoenicibacter congonensis]|uniref:translation initiation factor IF-3 n=1 Tax=Phoenicibacter congonensis TaxID=1944646 RepID=UPI0009A87156